MYLLTYFLKVLVLCVLSCVSEMHHNSLYSNITSYCVTNKLTNCSNSTVFFCMVVWRGPPPVSQSFPFKGSARNERKLPARSSLRSKRFRRVLCICAGITVSLALVQISARSKSEKPQEKGLLRRLGEKKRLSYPSLQQPERSHCRERGTPSRECLESKSSTEYESCLPNSNWSTARPLRVAHQNCLRNNEGELTVEILVKNVAKKRAKKNGRDT